MFTFTTEDLAMYLIKKHTLLAKLKQTKSLPLYSKLIAALLAVEPARAYSFDTEAEALEYIHYKHLRKFPLHNLSPIKTIILCFKLQSRYHYPKYKSKSMSLPPSKQMPLINFNILCNFLQSDISEFFHVFCFYAYAFAN